jgi:hypothetical protein
LSISADASCMVVYDLVFPGNVLRANGLEFSFHAGVGATCHGKSFRRRVSRSVAINSS